MSVWNKLILEPRFDRIKTVYNELFPLEVRFVCANWIEERMKADSFIDINDPQIQQTAVNFLSTLVEQLEHEKQKLPQAKDNSIKKRLDEAIQTYTQHMYHPFAIYKQMRDVIAFEQHFLQYFSENKRVDQEVVEIVEKLTVLENKVVLNNEKHMKLKQKFQNYDCETSESTSANAIQLCQSFADVIVEIDDVQKLIVVKRLRKWQRDQALSGNGAPLNRNTLDEIQSWFQKLAEIIWTTRCSIAATREIGALSLNLRDMIERAYKEITTLLENLIVSGFIVEKQPPQVMKTKTR